MVITRLVTMMGGPFSIRKFVKSAKLIGRFSLIKNATQHMFLGNMERMDSKQHVLIHFIHLLVRSFTKHRMVEFLANRLMILLEIK